MEKYIAIIKVLNNRGSQTEEQIMNNADLSLISPKEYLNFLINLELIAEKKLLTKTTYAVTPKGQRLCSYFKSNDHKAIFAETRIIQID